MGNPIVGTLHEQLQTTDGIKAAAREWYDSDVPDHLAEKWSGLFRKFTTIWTTSAGPVMWLKNRIRESALLPESGAKCSDNEAETLLHIGFCFILESEEMLARLRNEKAARGGKVARSKLVKDASVHTHMPIDRVAARVSPRQQDAPVKPAAEGAARTPGARRISPPE